MAISHGGEKDAPRQEAQEEEDTASKESTSEGEGQRHSGRSHKEQKKPGTGKGPRQGCSYWQGQGPARGALTTHPPGPAIDPIQAPPNTPREGKEEDPGEPVQEQGKEETRGSSTSKVLERLRRKLEEEKHQKEKRNIKLWRRIWDGERPFSMGDGELDR